MSTTSTVITVSQLTHAIKNQLESRFINLIIQGEMSNCKLQSSGHLYFDLKDQGAKVPAVFFRAKSTLTRLPKEGDHVIIKGALSVYPPHGKYQIICKSLDYQGVGALLLQLEALKQTLRSRGWFEKETKKSIPKFPKKIGVITSPTGAVIQDIIHVLSRRYSGFQLVLNPVRVQGAEAAYEIASAIEQMNRFKLCDVLIVGRGGGSLEDLWPFNEESVARAIFESEIPIISAVGHETDVTIADFVADMRAPTPSAAAEIVSAETTERLLFLKKVKQYLTSSLSHQLKHHRTRLTNYCRHPLFSTSYALIGGPLQKLDEIKTRLDNEMKQTMMKKWYALSGREKQARALQPRTQIHAYRLQLKAETRRLDQLIHNQLSRKKQKLKDIRQQLCALDPKNVLKRGYSILFALNKDSVIVSTQDVDIGDQVRAQLSDGKITLRVDNE